MKTWINSEQFVEPGGSVIHRKYVSPWVTEEAEKFLSICRLSVLEEREPSSAGPQEPGHWPDELSREAQRRLCREGIELPWSLGDTFGEKGFIVEGLRCGGMGVVFLVALRELGAERFFAAKTLKGFLRREYMELPQTVQEQVCRRFLEEAAPWLEMDQHAHIVPVRLMENVFSPIHGWSIPLVFSTFMPGGSLREFLLKNGPMSLKETLVLGIQLGEGLLHVFRHGLKAHLDLKPENILLGPVGEYRVTDFSAGAAGTPGYMSPEQVARYWESRYGKLLPGGSQPVDHRADQFAVGLVLCECLLGRHPSKLCREACEDERAARQFLANGPVDVSVGSFPKSIATTLGRVLALRPDDRYPHIGALGCELVKLHDEQWGSYSETVCEPDDSAVWHFDRGNAYVRLGRMEASEAEFRKARARLSPSSGPDIDQAHCAKNLGLVCRHLGRHQEAETMAKEALEIYRKVPGTELEQAACINDLGAIYRETCLYSEAEVSHQKALEIYLSLQGTEREQAETSERLGIAFHLLGWYEDARAVCEDALKFYRALPGNELETARCAMNLAVMYEQTRRFINAEVALKEALETYRRIPGTDRDKADCLLNLGALYQITGHCGEAEACTREALAIYLTIPGTERHQAGCKANLGDHYASTDRYSKAETAYREAMEMYRCTVGTQYDQGRCMLNLGNLHFQSGNLNQAETCWREALGICRNIPGTDRDKADCLLNLGVVYLQTGRHKEAGEAFEKALEIYRPCEETELDQALCGMNMGVVYRETGHYDDAETAYRDALKIYLSITATELQQAECLANLAELFAAIGRTDEACHYARQAMALCVNLDPRKTTEIRNICESIL